jgi:hypothetical protein
VPLSQEAGHTAPGRRFQEVNQKGITLKVALTLAIFNSFDMKIPHTPIYAVAAFATEYPAFSPKLPIF